MFVDSDFDRILISGRDPDGGRYRRTVHGVKSYFYVPSTKGKFVGLDGTQLDKVICKQFEIKGLLPLHSKTYESDVKLQTKYLIDNYDEIPEEPLRVCHIDIEVDDAEAYPNIDLADKAIISVCCYDSFKEKYHSFVLMPPGMVLEKNIKTHDWNVYFFETETAMIEKWIDFMDKMDFDVTLAWNGDGFDYPYIFTRMRGLGIDPEILSPVKKFNPYDNKPNGIAWLDLMVAFRKVSTSEMESFSLDYIANHVLGRGKQVHDGRVGELWRADFNAFVEYNKTDVTLMVEIENAKGIIKYFDTVRRLAFCSWYDIFYNTRVLDAYFLKQAHHYGVILPRRPPKIETDTIEGAIVITPKVGIFRNIAVGDVQSLYPTAILTCNMSPETISLEGEIQVGNVRFTNRFRGFVPRVVKDLWDLRQSWKKEMRKYPVHSAEYDKWDNLQTVMKFLLNSIYGALLMPGFRLYRKEIGAAITYFGRKTNMQMQKVVKAHGCIVAYGDTDSTFFEARDLMHAIEVIDAINASLDNFCIKEFGTAEYNRMFVEFDKMYSTIFFIGNEKGKAVKKRYAGLIMAVDGVELNEPYMDMKGFDARRSDSPKFIRELQKSVLNRILLGEVKHQIVRDVRNERMKIEMGMYTPEQVAIPKGLSKYIDEYDKTLPIHVRGARYYNEHCGGKIKREKVKYIYVLSSPSMLPPTDVISFVDKAPDGFKYDYSKMAKKLIDLKFVNIFASMGWSINELLNRTLDDFI